MALLQAPERRDAALVVWVSSTHAPFRDVRAGIAHGAGGWDVAVVACRAGMIMGELPAGYDCGDCGRACTDGKVCSGGQCVLDCVGGTTLCDGLCVDVSSDRNHCGDCATTCPSG